MSSPCDHMKEFCAHLSTPRMWETKRWGPPPVDEDWHAFCQVNCQGVEGREWEALYYQYKDLHQAGKSKKSGEPRDGNVLRALKDAKGKGIEFHDAGHEKEIKTRAHLRLDIWAVHLKNPTAARSLWFSF